MKEKIFFHSKYIIGHRKKIFEKKKKKKSKKKFFSLLGSIVNLLWIRILFSLFLLLLL